MRIWHLMLLKAIGVIAGRQRRDHLADEPRGCPDATADHQVKLALRMAYTLTRGRARLNQS